MSVVKRTGDGRQGGGRAGKGKVTVPAVMEHLAEPRSHKGRAAAAPGTIEDRLRRKAAVADTVGPDTPDLGQMGHEQLRKALFGG